jgi:AcrR family transcriptional regulator
MATAPQSSAQRRAQLIEVALGILRTEPFDNLTVDRVAEAAGVSQPLMFHYFKNRQGFHKAVLLAAAEEFQQHMTPDPAQPLQTQLRTGISAFVEVVTTNPTSYLAVVRMAGSGDPDMRAMYRSTRANFTELMARTAQGVGIEVTPALRAAFQGWQAFMEEVILSWVDEPTMSLEEMTDLCERAFVSLALAAGLPFSALEATLTA